MFALPGVHIVKALGVHYSTYSIFIYKAITTFNYYF